MTDTLYRLAYQSESRIAGSADDVDDALRDILASARRVNSRLGVSGVLMFNANWFVQVLEGPRAAVENLFKIIKADSRHDKVAVLTFAPIAEREFGYWSMAFVGPDEAEGPFEAFARESGHDPAHMSGDATLQFLRDTLRAQVLMDHRLAG